MMRLIISIYFLATSVVFSLETNLVNLEGSYGHRDHGLEKIDHLNPHLKLTLTIVTGTWVNTQLVSEYYSTFENVNIFDKTEMDFKIEGKVFVLSQIFNTTFLEYNCPNLNMNKTCFASTSEVVIPSNLKSSILGIIGLEQVLTLKPNFVVGEKLDTLIQASTGFNYFLGPQAAQVYGFPNSNGSGVRVGIVSLGGFFNQSDLQNYFTLLGLGSAPNINVVLIDGAFLNYNDLDSSVENYLDVEIISTVAPEANITFYFAPNTWPGFYDVIKAALQNSDVVSLSWGNSEINDSAYYASFEALFALYSNVPCFIATGDNGSDVGVGFPASCPSAIG